MSDPGIQPNGQHGAEATSYTQGPPAFPTWPAQYVQAAAVEPLVGELDAPLARRLLLVALALGLAAQLLFVAQGIGVNVVIGTALLLGSAWLARPAARSLDAGDRWIPLAALAFAALAAIRADEALIAFNVGACLALTGGSIVAFAGIPVTRRSLGGLTALLVRGGAVVGIGAVRLQPGAHSLVSTSFRPARMGAVVTGLLVALPIVTVFAALFASADSVFSQALANILRLDLDLGDLPARIAVTAGVAWVVASAFVLIRAATDHFRRDEPFTTTSRFAADSAVVALIALDALFAAFVLIQGTYLFGGQDTLAASGMTYANYARRGFFELVIVATLVGLMVLSLEAIVASRTRAYRGAVLTLLGLTGVILLSAGVRLAIYQQAYGWTELRFYVASAIGWLGLCIVAAAVAVVLNRSRWLPHATLILGFLVALVVNGIDPQTFVAEQNVARALDPSLVAPDGRSGLDAEYLGSLGDGAVPVLVDALPKLIPGDQRTVARALAARRDELRDQGAREGWPSINFGRVHAFEKLESATLP